jgi:hypothetical protein
MRKCFVHIGTHKTGTTSIQAMLAGHRPDLARHGFLYPMAGIPDGLFGHHNTAWELMGDHRFRPQNGTVADLLDEVDKSELDLVLSSEDFECAAHDRAAFATFIGALRRRALEVTIVIYLRNQVDYARSLYLELLQHQYDATFDEFVSKVLEHRTIRWKQSVFAFCYREFLKQLPAETNIVVRSYDRMHSVIDDFASILGLSTADLNVHSDLCAQRQLPISGAFAAFYQNRTSNALDAGPPWLLPLIARAFDGPEVGMARVTRERLIAAYHESNHFVESRYGLSGLMDMPRTRLDSAGEVVPSLEDIFSATTTHLVEVIVEMQAELEGDLLGGRSRAAESAQAQLRDQLVEAHASLLERDVLAREMFERLKTCDEQLLHLKTREQQLLRYLKTRDEQLLRDLRVRDEQLRELSVRLKARQDEVQDLSQRLRAREWELRHIQGSRVWRVATMVWNLQKRLGRR